MAYSYYFDSKKNKEIVLYDEFPNMDQIYDYYKQNNFAILHPLYEYGNFEIKELAEIIKFIYSIKYQSDYQVITTGTLTENVSMLLDGEICDIIPNLYFLVGNDKSLQFCLPYNGLFLEDGRKVLLPDQSTNSMIALLANRSIVKDTLGVTTSCSDSSIETNGIIYYNYLQEKFENVNIWKGIERDIPKKLKYISRNG